MKRVLVLTDNRPLFTAFKDLAGPLADIASFEYACTPGNPEFAAEIRSGQMRELKVAAVAAAVAKDYALIVSAHSKQLFPPELVRGARCINVHPGLNPHNRGWYPQVFGILNGLPLGATIHEIDEQLDHGPIIAQRTVPVFEHDTSETAYLRVLEAEKSLLAENFRSIVMGTYSTRRPEAEGNLNLRADFDRLRVIDLEEKGTFRDFYNRLRALTHGSFRNAYFAGHDGKRVYLRLVIEKDD